MSVVSKFLEVLRKYLDGGVEAIRLVPLYGTSLHPKPPGVKSSHQGGSAGGALRTGVGLSQTDSFSRIFLKYLYESLEQSSTSSSSTSRLGVIKKELCQDTSFQPRSSARIRIILGELTTPELTLFLYILHYRPDIT